MDWEEGETYYYVEVIGSQVMIHYGRVVSSKPPEILKLNAWRTKLEAKEAAYKIEKILRREDD